jgi:hypothetical protein
MSAMSTEAQLRPQLPEPIVPNFDSLPRSRLESMAAAGLEVRDCLRVLAKAELNTVGEVLRGHGPFTELEHYPPDDVFDRDSQAQYYYHAHRGIAGENGHFHTFLRAPGMPAGAQPVAHAGSEPWPTGEEALSHLIAISMDAYGLPIGLFAVNRWVTAEAWYDAEDVIRMLERFVIDHAFPSWPVNRWIGATMRLFHPQIETLIRHRDASVDAWKLAYPEVDVFEDRRLEVTGELRISIDDQISSVLSALAR